MTLSLTILYVLAVLLSIIVGCLVSVSRVPNPIKISMISFIFAIIGLTISMYCAYYFSEYNYEYTLWSIRGTFGFGILSSYSLFELAYYYPKKLFTLPQWTLWGMRIMTIFVVIIATFTELIYEGQFITETEIEDLHGSFHWLFLLLHIFYLFSAIYFFVKKSFTLEGIEKKKVVLISKSAGTLALIILFAYTILPRFDIYIIQREAVLLTGIMAMMIFYSMMKYRFLDVKVTVGRWAKVLTSIFFAVLILYFFYAGIDYFNIHLPYACRDTSYIFVGLLVLTLILQYGVPTIFHKLFGLTSFEHFKQVMKEIKKDLSLATTVDDLEKALREFMEAIHIDYVEIILMNPTGHKRKNIHIGYSEKKGYILVKREIPYLQHRERWFTEKEAGKDVVEKGELSIPLYTSTKELFAFVILGQKRFGDLYTVQEVHELQRLQDHLQLRVLSVMYREQLQREVQHKTEELRKRNEEMAYANQRLQELDVAKDKFLSIASHELRTPLTVINGFTDLLMSDRFGKLTKKQKEFLETIEGNTKELREFVNKMLDVAQLEADKMKFEIQKIDIIEFIQKIVDEFGVLCEQKNIELKFSNLAEKEIQVETDPMRLKQIFNNLLSNAHKYTQDNGTIEVRIDTCVQHECDLKDIDCVHIDVVDNGMGIPKKDLISIFDRFQQSTSARNSQHKGTGLGLSIVKMLIDKFKGTVEVESNIGRGTTISFCLPRICRVENKDNIIKLK